MQLRPDPMPVAQALQALLERGTRWQSRGLDPTTGCGCYGLVYFAFRQAGITLPTLAEDAHTLFVQVLPPYQPFDVVMGSLGPLMGARHLGLLLSPGQGYHISQATNGLARFSLRQAFWKRIVRHGLRYSPWCSSYADCPQSAI
jgi:cell wall-associated NlpC family hydrolase